VIEYLNNKILISDVLNITCPSINCASTLDDTFITNLVSKETYEKYKKYNHSIKKILKVESTQQRHFD
jgi:deoxycytidylate deaminase